MKPISIALVCGTRPEAIKLAPVYLRLREQPETFAVCMIVTAQHRQMLDQMLGVFGIKPDVDLDIMQSDQSLAEITTRALQGVEGVLQELRAELVMVQGDTTTTLAASLAAYYQRIKVAHVEAGLRTADKFSPFPEEMNRRLTSVLADFHFAATPRAKANLLAEGGRADSIFVTGNPVVDALHHIRRQQPTLAGTDYAWIEQIPGRLLLVTAHRRENWGVPFTRICAALRQIAKQHPDVTIVYPVHPNPKVRQAAYELLGGVGNLALCEPPDYLTFVAIMSRADLIITDSGGIQEEAPSLGIPVLVIREKTERPEGIAAGVARLVGTETEAIVSACDQLLTNPSAYSAMASQVSPYGDGQAARRICDALAYVCGRRRQPPDEFQFDDSCPQTQLADPAAGIE